MKIKDASWLELETKTSKFKDGRLNTRFKSLMGQIWAGIGKTIPYACQDWANTKAAYRFFSNDRVSEIEILQGHFQSTKDRCDKIKGPIFILQDTTEFSYKREKPELIGLTRVIKTERVYGHPMFHSICGLLMHSSLAVTPEGLPLGLTAIKFWTRKKLQGRILKNKVNATRIPIEEKESIRWLENMRNTIELLEEPKKCIHIGDRENDIYEFFCLANELKTNFIVRARLDRLCSKQKRTIIEEMDEASIKGAHRIELKILPPEGKKKRYPAIYVTIVHGIERDTPIDIELGVNLAKNCG